MQDSCAASNEWRDSMRRAAFSVRLLAGYPFTPPATGPVSRQRPLPSYPSRYCSLTVIHSDESRFDYLGTLVRSPLVSLPPQFILYAVSSIHFVSDTKPRSPHRADAQRLVAPVRLSETPYWCFPHVVSPVMIGLNLDIENALGDGSVALYDFSTLDAKIESKII
eukprot:6192525-Pleurochrysis_carterae.AAC.2